MEKTGNVFAGNYVVYDSGLEDESEKKVFPEEIVLEIFSYFTFWDLDQSSGVNRTWNRIVNKIASSEMRSYPFGQRKWEKHFGNREIKLPLLTKVFKFIEEHTFWSDDKSKLNRQFDTVGVEPPLPGNIFDILSSPCPFWPKKKVFETHLLVLVPKTVNGKPFTLRSLGELIKKPKDGNATKYEYVWVPLMQELGDTSVTESHWLLMTRNVIPGSRKKRYSVQRALFKQKEQTLMYLAC